MGILPWNGKLGNFTRMHSCVAWAVLFQANWNRQWTFGHWPEPYQTFCRQPHQGTRREYQAALHNARGEAAGAQEQASCVPERADTLIDASLSTQPTPFPPRPCRPPVLLSVSSKVFVRRRGCWERMLETVSKPGGCRVKNPNAL